jgi:hypothetical protein
MPKTEGTTVAVRVIACPVNIGFCEVVTVVVVFVTDGATTVKFAVLLGKPAVGVWSVTIPEVVFGCTPTVLLLTGKITVQLPFAGIVTLKFKVVAPVGREEVHLAQVPVNSPPTAVIFVKLSVNKAFVKVMLFLFVNVSVTTEFSPA